MNEEKGLIAQILPRTLAGLAAWLVVFATGMAVSGIALFAFYQYRVSSLEQRLLGFNEQFQKEFDKKSNEFKELSDNAKADIEKAAGSSGSKTNEMTKLLEKVGPSIALIHGIDPNGQPAVGTGFIVSSNNSQTWLLTTFQTVGGSVAKQEPVRIRLGKTERESRVYSWDDPRDLALVILPTGDLPVIEWAKDDPPIGARIWAIAAAGGRFGASAAEGTILDVFGEGLLTDADVPPHSSGGPLLNRDGLVMGILSLRYSPAGYPPANGWAVPIRMTCQKVLRCPEG